MPTNKDGQPNSSSRIDKGKGRASGRPHESEPALERRHRRIKRDATSRTKTYSIATRWDGSYAVARSGSGGDQAQQHVSGALSDDSTAPPRSSRVGEIDRAIEREGSSPARRDWKDNLAFGGGAAMPADSSRLRSSRGSQVNVTIVQRESQTRDKHNSDVRGEGRRLEAAYTYDPTSASPSRSAAPRRGEERLSGRERREQDRSTYAPSDVLDTSSRRDDRDVPLRERDSAYASSSATVTDRDGRGEHVIHRNDREAELRRDEARRPTRSSRNAVTDHGRGRSRAPPPLDAAERVRQPDPIVMTVHDLEGARRRARRESTTGSLRRSPTPFRGLRRQSSSSLSSASSLLGVPGSGAFAASSASSRRASSPAPAPFRETHRYLVGDRAEFGAVIADFKRTRLGSLAARAPALRDRWEHALSLFADDGPARGAPPAVFCGPCWTADSRERRTPFRSVTQTTVVWFHSSDRVSKEVCFDCKGRLMCSPY
ncbi:hypothetical protein Q5752_005607 [Cryptotrichosporon argae]